MPAVPGRTSSTVTLPDRSASTSRCTAAACWSRRNRPIADWPPQTFSDLAAEHFEQIRQLAPEVVVLGTGSRLQFPRLADTRALIQANIGLEVMDTGAACRTYNILMQDGRRVVAALLMIES